MTTRFLSATCALAHFAATMASASDDFYLGEIIISGGFTPIDEEKFGRSASIITSDDIEERGITTVQNALRALPGVSVSSSGSSLTDVRIRGGEARHTLVLIDGVPAGGGNQNYSFSGLETANIERIEVLRGPQSVFYGSNASNGVINIITKTGGLGQEIAGSLEFGGATTATARFSTRTNRGGVALNLSHTDDKGFDYSGSGGEKDSLERSTFHLNADYLITDQIKLGLTLRHSDETFDTDEENWLADNAGDYVVDNPDLFGERTEQLASLWTEIETMGGQLNHRVAFDFSSYKASSNGETPVKADRKSLRYLLSYGLDGRSVSQSDHLVNVITEYREDSATSSSDYKPARASYAIEYRGELTNGLNLQGGVRYDKNKTFEDNITWNFGASYMLATGVRLHASAGEGIVDPTYLQLFDDPWGTIGNADLRPEKNRGFDIGVEVPFAQGRGVLDLTYFDENLKDEIVYYFDADAGHATYKNQDGDSKRRGVEVSGRYAATDILNLSLSYTYIDASNEDGSLEVRRPKHELMLSASQDILQGRGNFNADVRYVADNYDTQWFGADYGAAKKLPDFATVDVAANYALNDQLTLTGRVTNLFDKEYSETWGYATRGRTFYVGVRSSF